MKKLILIGLVSLLLVGCGTKKETYKTISAEEAKEMMAEDVVILDVRTEEEYGKDHIKNALNIPLDSIGDGNELLPAKDATVLVYCASGKRSKEAAQKLWDMGYKKVYNFGGLSDWTYEVVDAKQEEAESVVYIVMSALKIAYLDNNSLSLPLTVTCAEVDGTAKCTYGDGLVLDLSGVLPTAGTITLDKDGTLEDTTGIMVNGLSCSIHGATETVSCK